jgi:serine/threonine-protein kinase
MLEAGAIVAGKLRIERLLGRGGMGTVAIATHVQLDQQVAIKVLHSEMAHDPDVVARFLREARASARLKSEHVCHVTDVGQLDTGEPYFVMELLDGADLAHVIEHQPLPVPYACDYVLQACVAIAEAHALGIVHRDLKPANLFVTRRLDGTPLVKVLDFGIATAPASDFKITRTTTVMGSPGYMSPEHLKSARDVDPRSDIWSLGVILYEVVSGRLPFTGESITELAVKVVVDAPAPLDDVDPRFVAVVMRCLDKQPAQRYQTIAQLAADLAPLATPSGQHAASLIARMTGGAMTAAPSAILASSGTGPTTIGTASGQTVAPPRRRGRIALIAAAATLIATGGIVAAVVASRGGDTSSEPHDAARIAAVARDAAAAPPAPPDAAASPVVVADAAVDERVVKLRERLHELAAAKDWRTILEVGDVLPDDPDVVNAREQYLAEQRAALDRFVAAGDCAHAQGVVAAAHKLVPDDDTLAARAKTCKPKVTPPPTDLEVAQAALARDDYAAALAAAEKVLAKTPNDEAALKFAATAACDLKDATKAKEYIAKLQGRDRDAVVFLCRENKVAIGPQPVSPEALAKANEEVREATTARNRADWGAALKHAQEALKLNPGHPGALPIAFAAACHLHDAKTATALFRRFKNPRQQDAQRRECQRDGLTLP